jgi:hypothetical protein
MKRRRITVLTVVLACSLLAVVASATSPAATINWDAFGGGGGPMSSASYAVGGGVGQAITGGFSSAGYGVRSGFWAGMPAGGVPTPPARLIYLPLVARAYR